MKTVQYNMYLEKGYRLFLRKTQLRKVNFPEKVPGVEDQGAGEAVQNQKRTLSRTVAPKILYHV